MFIQENALENVVLQNGGHLVQGKWVNVLQFQAPTTVLILVMSVNETGFQAMPKRWSVDR